MLRPSFIVIDANRPTADPLRLRVDDLHPEITEVAPRLIDGWADKELRPQRRVRGGPMADAEGLARDRIGRTWGQTPLYP